MTSVYNRTHFLYNTTLNSIWFFFFPVRKSNTNKCVGIKPCTNDDSLWSKIFQIELKLFKPLGIEYMDPNSYYELFIKNTYQSVGYVIETQIESLSYINMPDQ